MAMAVLRSDPALVRDAQHGDKRAFAELAERHYARLLSACRRMLGNPEPARDAAQEAVVRAMLGINRLADPDRFGAWLTGIGLNVCRSLLSVPDLQNGSLEVLLDDGRLVEPVSAASTPAELAEMTELAMRARAAIAELPAGQREAVVLFYLAGLTHAEIAEKLGTRPGAVKTRLHKARTALRAPLHDYEEHFTVTNQSTELIPMHVAELRRTRAADPLPARHIVFLEDGDGGRRLPIWIGPAEASALAVILDDVELPRPGVYQFAASLLTASSAQLREVRIVALTNFTFYAQAVLANDTTVDARPSDALTLALVTGAPIYVAAAVLERAVEHQEAMSDMIEEAERAPDDAHAIAEDVRKRLADSAAQLAERRKRS
jgi:RNA polymerase sigma factor (sigma-70 family)